jgi:hypothetical protein
MASISLLLQCLLRFRTNLKSSTNFDHSFSDQVPQSPLQVA